VIKVRAKVIAFALSARASFGVPIEVEKCHGGGAGLMDAMARVAASDASLGQVSPALSRPRPQRRGRLSLCSTG